LDMADIIDEPALRNKVRVFDDRFHAGELLANKLENYRGRDDAYILAIPAGGVQVAFVVARRLGIPLDVAVTRKLHVPWDIEVGFGALSWNGDLFINELLVSQLGLTREEVDRCISIEKEAVRKRLEKFRGERPFPDLKGKAIIVVDDGLASGFSMLATLAATKRRQAKERIVAVPTGSYSAAKLVGSHADMVICLNLRSGPFYAVADAYKLWYDLGDEDVLKLLHQLNTGQKT
jgi:putative phosphoribosyl transferase